MDSAIESSRSTFHLVVPPDHHPLWRKWFGDPELEFIVEGKPCGFVSSGHKHWTKRTSKAWGYASSVREAMQRQVGWPHLVANKENQLLVGTIAYFENGTHPDPENVHKLIKDALFHKAPGGDKHTGGIYAPPLYDRQAPRVEILVWKV